MAFPDEIANRLVAQGVGVINTNIFKGARAVMPTGPGPYLTIIEYGGPPPTRIQDDVLPNYDEPNFQLLVRGSDYQAVRIMLMAGRDALVSVVNLQLSGVFYLWIKVKQSVPIDLAADSANRTQLELNFSAFKEHS